MKDTTRYRISGSLFLVALAVIFVPMIFDGGRPPAEVIPPKPTETIAFKPVEAEELVPAEALTERVREFKAEVDEAGFSTTTGEKFGEPVLTPETETTKVWAVQAASFGNWDNAVRLRGALRDAGLEAFISSAKDRSLEEDDTPVMYRVAVGPLLARSDASAIAAQIADAHDIQPQIVEMTP